MLASLILWSAANIAYAIEILIRVPEYCFPSFWLHDRSLMGGSQHTHSSKHDDTQAVVEMLLFLKS